VVSGLAGGRGVGEHGEGEEEGGGGELEEHVR